MELVWKQLLNVMGAMNEICQGMVDLALKQRNAVVKEEIQTVGQLVIEQEHILNDFQALELERRELLKTLSRQLEIPEKELTANRLLQAVPASWSNAYRLQIAALKKITAEVKQAHEINRKLINHSQQFVGWLIRFLVTPEGAGPVYDAQGDKAQRSYYHVFNQAL